METLKVKVTNLGRCYGIRLIDLRTNEVVDQCSVKTRLEVGEKIKDMLRWQNKMGSMSPMAAASRDRHYCGTCTVKGQ